MCIKLMTDGDKNQQLRVIRILQALGSALIQSTVAWILFFAGGFRLSGIGFTILMGGLWVGHISFYLLIRSGFNKRFSDPSLTQALVVWGVFSTLLTLSFMMKFRFMMLPFLLLILIFGAFKMTGRQYIAIVVFIVLGYSSVMGLIYSRYPEMIRLEDEFACGLAFTLTVLAFSFVGNEISQLRFRLSQRNSELALAMQQVEQMARTDELTGLINRREMMSLLNRQKAKADRGKSNFCVCFFDIDHFKRVNDSFGHHVGDVVLKRFAAQALKSTRNADLFARFGGEEFLLLATDNDMEGAATAAERIRETISGIDFSDLSPDLCVTLSAGVAQFEANEDIRTLLTRADKALYLAKNSGRNCIKMKAKSVKKGDYP